MAKQINRIPPSQEFLMLVNKALRDGEVRLPVATYSAGMRVRNEFYAMRRHLQAIEAPNALAVESLQIGVRYDEVRMPAYRREVKIGPDDQLSRAQKQLAPSIIVVAPRGGSLADAVKSSGIEFTDADREGLGEVSMVIPEMNERIEGHVDTMDDALADAGYGDERDEG